MDVLLSNFGTAVDATRQRGAGSQREKLGFTSMIARALLLALVSGSCPLQQQLTISLRVIAFWLQYS